MLLIFAGNQHQASHCAKELGAKQFDWRYIGTIYDVRGYQAPVVIRYGNWFDREDSVDVMTALRICNAVILTIKS